MNFFWFQVAGKVSDPSSGARNILKRVSKPTAPEAKGLSKFIRSTSGADIKKHPFDPMTPSVVALQKSEKKRAIPATNLQRRLLLCFKKVKRRYVCMASRHELGLCHCLFSQ